MQVIDVTRFATNSLVDQAVEAGQKSAEYTALGPHNR